MKKHLNKILLLISILFIIIGIRNEEFKLVLSKAARICLECIGIG